MRTRRWPWWFRFMCGSGRLETSCHSGAMMAGTRKMGRGRFAGNSAKLTSGGCRLSVLKTRAPHVFASNRLVTTVALGRQTHYTMT
jgi:hypothetical protein